MPDALFTATPAYDLNFHSVEIVPGTRLSSLYPGVERVRVNSIHHQAIKDLSLPGLKPKPTA